MVKRANDNAKQMRAAGAKRGKGRAILNWFYFCHWLAENVVPLFWPIIDHGDGKLKKWQNFFPHNLKTVSSVKEHESSNLINYDSKRNGLCALWTKEENVFFSPP